MSARLSLAIWSILKSHPPKTFIIICDASGTAIEAALELEMKGELTVFFSTKLTPREKWLYFPLMD